MKSVQFPYRKTMRCNSNMLRSPGLHGLGEAFRMWYDTHLETCPPPKCFDRSKWIDASIAEE